MYEKLVEFVIALGIWRGERRETHSFLVSPEPHIITKSQGDQLNKISQALHGVLKGLSRIFTIATDPILGSPRCWSELGRMMRLQVPSYFEGIMGLNPGSVPFLNKIDLVEDGDGKFWIVEIDAGNPRALGYSAFFEMMLGVSGIKKSFPGILNPLVQSMGKNGDKLICMVSDRERWYLPWFEVLTSMLVDEGVDVSLVQESNFLYKGDKTSLLYKPLIMGSVGTRSALLEGYKRGDVNFLMPPKPFLGSKAMLVIVCNIAQDPLLEGILRSQILEEHLGILRAHIPPTTFLKTSGNGTGELLVLKSLVSSGMKGVFFSDQPDYNPAVSEHTKRGGAPTAVLQKVIEGKQHTFNYFESGGNVVRDQRYVHFIAHCGPRGVADVFVTARVDKAVHGAKDAILTGCVIR